MAALMLDLSSDDGCGGVMSGDDVVDTQVGERVVLDMGPRTIHVIVPSTIIYTLRKVLNRIMTFHFTPRPRTTHTGQQQRRRRARRNLVGRVQHATLYGCSLGRPLT